MIVQVYQMRSMSIGQQTMLQEAAMAVCKETAAAEQTLLEMALLSRMCATV
jgi:hypothetical protein